LCQVESTRILVLSSEYRDTGSYMRAYQVARSLASIGHSVELPAAPPQRMVLRMEMVASALRYALTSSRSRFDVVLAVKPYPNAGLAIILNRGRSLCVVDVDDLDFAYREGWSSRAIRLSQSPFPRQADLVTCHSERLAKKLMELHALDPKRMYRLDQGVDTRLFDPRRPEIQQTAEALRLEKPKLIVNLCHFDAAADLDQLTWALAMAMEEDAEIKAVLVGGGPLLSRYRELVNKAGLRDSISLAGALGPEEVCELIAGGNVCTVFYAERQANLYRSSLKLREYLAMGKKVVCTNVGELADFSPYTYQTPPDVAEFAEELVRVVGIEKSPRAKRGSRYVRSRFSWQCIAKAFGAELEELLQSCPHA